MSLKSVLVNITVYYFLRRNMEDKRKKKICLWFGVFKTARSLQIMVVAGN